MPHKKKKEKNTHERKPHKGRHSPTLFNEQGHHDHINVNVVVNEKQDDCLTSCFSSCFKAGTKAAT